MDHKIIWHVSWLDAQMNEKDELPPEDFLFDRRKL